MSSPSQTEHERPPSSPQYSNLSVYAFLNHSPETLPHNLPPHVDDKPLARQRRRRTSPEDQAILEAAYSRDPKPDKAARMELVSRVALGDKEVQIWFQNRRQTSRRKSRPLLPHEVAQYHMSRLGSRPHHDSEPGSSMTAGSVDQPPAAHGTDGTAENEHHGSSCASNSSPQSSQSEHSVRHQSHLGPEPIAGKTQPIGYLANRRSGPARLTHDDSVESFESVPSIGKLDQILPLKKSSSVVRLSMTADGTARVVTKDAASPSPPRPNNVAVQPPVASYTGAISKINLPMPGVKPLQRSSSGRSRDSRTWEFWCDKEARNDLQDKAQKDASGSAADAIGLLRSTSGRTVLGALSSKRNAMPSKRRSPHKRAKTHPYHGTLHKSTSSFARLESKTSPSLKQDASPTSIHIPGNESDKENWSPDRDGGFHYQESNGMTGESTRKHGSERKPDHEQTSGEKVKALSKQSEGPEHQDRIDPETDPELSAFMRGGKRTGEGAHGEEMDCVQGLLSLSQGNWR